MGADVLTLSMKKKRLSVGCRRCTFFDFLGSFCPFLALGRPSRKSRARTSATRHALAAGGGPRADPGRVRSRLGDPLSGAQAGEQRDRAMLLRDVQELLLQAAHRGWRHVGRAAHAVWLDRRALGVRPRARVPATLRARARPTALLRDTRRSWCTAKAPGSRITST